jgi:RNA polymerase sigma-70 factor, ECF subfamily
MKADEWLVGAAEEYRSRMLVLARSIVKNRSDAEDVVQEALLRAWRSRGRFINGSRAEPWLLKITKNAALDFLRGYTTAENTDCDAVCAQIEPPEHDVEQRDKARTIASAIRRLAPAHRTAFVLHDLHGYSSREISMEVHRPYATVRTHLFRARRELRSALSGVEL